MTDATEKIAKLVDEIQQDQRLEREFQERAGNLEGFYQAMLALGIARKEDYNVISPVEITRMDVTFLVR